MNPERRTDTLERLLAERAWVRRLAGALVRNAELSDDLTQDAYVIALERAPASGESASEVLELEAATLEGRTPEADTDKSPVGTGGAPEGAVLGKTVLYTGRVVEPKGRGVVGANVFLKWWSAEPKKDDPGQGFHLVIRREREIHEKPRTTTGTDGFFRFDRPYPGHVWLCVEAEGFEPALAGPVPSDSSTVIVLSRSVPLLVRVRGPDGKVLPGAEVRLVTAPHTLGLPGLTVQARHVLHLRRTDEAGVTRLPAVPGPGLRLEVDSPAPEHGFYERAISPDDREVEVQLPSVRVVERRIVDAKTNLPVPGAYVSVLASTRGAITPEFDQLRRRFSADADGIVRFPHQQGYYREYATAPGYEVVHAWEDPIRLLRAMRIEGTVTTADGTPVPRAALVMAGGRGSLLDGILVGERAVMGWSNEDGRFEIFVKLPHGFGVSSRAEDSMRSVVALHPDHAPAIEDRIEVAPGRTRVVHLVVPEPARLTVEVVDAEGTPCVDEWINATREIPRRASAETRAHPLEGHYDPLHLLRGDMHRTDAQGRCVIEGLCPGRWCVYTQIVNYWVRVDLQAGQDRTVRLAKTGRLAIEGRVLDANGRPYRGSVILQGPKVAMARADSEGRFAFSDLESGEYTIWLCWDVGPARMDLHRPVRTGETVEIRLPDPARLRLHVEGPPPESVEYALLTAPGGLDPHEVGFTKREIDSGLTRAFTPGPGLLLVRAEGYGWTAVRFEGAPGRTEDVRVRMEPAGTVRGRVEGALRGKRCNVRLRRLDDYPAALIKDQPKLDYLIGHAMGSPHVFVVVDEEGTFESTDVTPSIYEAAYYRYDPVARTETFGPTVRVEVTSGGISEIELLAP